LANWTPEGFLGELFGIVGSFVPPPPNTRSPMLWGSESYMVELFGPRASELRCVRRHFNFRYRSAAHWIEVFRSFYGPIHKAFGALDGERQSQLNAAITELLSQWNIGGSYSLIVPGEYLEIVITKA